MAYSYTFSVPAVDVLIVGTGGDTREIPEYRDGSPTGQPERHTNGAAIRGLSGVSVSVGGNGLDGAEVSTTTPLESVPAGQIFRASGEVTVTTRVQTRMVGRGADKRPKGDVIANVFVENLEPVGDVNQLLASTPAKKATSNE